MKGRPAAEGLNIEDILVCSHPDCEFSVTVKNNKARESHTGGPVFCVCGAVMQRVARKDTQPGKPA